MRHFLTPDDYVKIRALFADGMSKKEIATAIGFSTSTVSDVINNPQRKCSVDKIHLPRGTGAFKEFQEMDLSTLPDTVLFQYSKDMQI